MTEVELLNKLYKLVRKRAELEGCERMLKTSLDSNKKRIFDVDMRIKEVLTEIECQK